MNSSQILRALKQNPVTKDQFIGVFASNRLPLIKRKPCCFVANTDVDAGPGEHWVAIYIDEDGLTDYFDSYGNGMSPILDNFKKFLMKSASRLNVNDKQLQGYMSSACGQYCIYFLFHRCSGIPMNEIVKLFNNTFINDSYVTEFVNKFFNLKTEVFEEKTFVNQMCVAFGIK